HSGTEFMPAKLLEDIRTWLWGPGGPETLPGTGLSARGRHSDVPPAFVIDDQDSICTIISTILATSGVDVERFHGAGEAVAALERGQPSIVFLDIALRNSDAVDVIRGLARTGYQGIVQLMSGSDVQLLDDIRRVGVRHGLDMWEPITKPFRAETIRQ